MATITEIRDALADQVETLDAVRATKEWGEPINVSGTASVAVVEYDGTVYDSAMGGQGDALTYKITLLVGKVGDRSARGKLDVACDPTSGNTTSMRQAVNGRLGGLVAFATVLSNTGYREYPIGPGDEAPRYLGAEFTVQVAT